MPTVWIPEAVDLGDGSIGGPMDTPGLPPRVVWHTTESGAGDAAFASVADYLARIANEPHLLYDPTTDKLGQYGPLDRSARALANDGSTRTNRTGRVCIQIEVLARAGKPFTGYWQPGPNFRALMKAVRSWSIPDRFPLPLAGAYGGGVRTRSVWLNTGGHYGHCNVPGNDHWDPGLLNTAALFAAASEDDMPLTAAEKTELVDRTAKKVLDGIFARVFKTDAIASPPDAADHDTNPFWAFDTHVRTTTIASREARTAAQQARDGIAAVAVQLAELESLVRTGLADPAGTAARLAELLESLRLRIEVEPPPST